MVPSDDLRDAYAEVAASKASLILGFPYIPIIVIRKINGKVASIQIYISNLVVLIEEGEYKKSSY